jgi:hypothetical protein
MSKIKSKYYCTNKYQAIISNPDLMINDFIFKGKPQSSSQDLSFMEFAGDMG